jgi:hypothetical protein
MDKGEIVAILQSIQDVTDQVFWRACCHFCVQVVLSEEDHVPIEDCGGETQCT